MKTFDQNGPVVLASQNVGKLRELRDLLAPLGVSVLSLARFSSAAVPEEAATFVENALIKARSACIAAQLPAVADDSGLEVDALDGWPGVFSARYAGPDATDDANNVKLLEALANIDSNDRTARFRSVVVFLRNASDPAPIITEGVWEGQILLHACGEGGFGYDSLFFDPACGLSAAQLTPLEKNRRSHRGMAMRQLCERLRVEWLERDA